MFLFPAFRSLHWGFSSHDVCAVRCSDRKLRETFRGVCIFFEIHMNNSSTSFRDLLDREGPILLAGAHDGMSARLVEEAGFDAVWASGFEISAAAGVPDASILTMTENLAAARTMVERVQIPVLADCDSGYGNVANVVRMVREYEQSGIAGICIEDNPFPKECSFYPGAERPLASIQEHVRRVRACLEARTSKDFVVVARTEALVAGRGVEEALRRAEAYADAGADLCLIHSKSETADEVLAVAARWKRSTPLVCVPTIYRHATVEELHAGGYKVVIFANHGLRSAVRAMRETFARILEMRSAGSVEDRIVSLKTIFELVGVDEMKAQELHLATSDAVVKNEVLEEVLEEVVEPFVLEER